MLESSALITRLKARLETADAPGPFLSARAGNAYCLRSIRTSGPFISLVLKGRKRIHHDAEVYEAVPGNVAVVSAACCIDVENIPDAKSGEYLAALMVLPESVLSITRALLDTQPVASAPPTTDDSPCNIVPLETIGSEVAQCVELGTTTTLPRLNHALLGLLLKLHESGVTRFLRPVRPRLADSISTILAADPAREWRSTDVESHLAMSGATLRRQLAAEQTSLRQILTETRLGQALQLLQSTRLPVKTVAARSGYRSVSSFVRRFHERYGVEPSRVANAN